MSISRMVYWNSFMMGKIGLRSSRRENILLLLIRCLTKPASSWFRKEMKINSDKSLNK
jgi:hypothetical protein